MPLLTVTLRKGKSAAFKKSLGDAVQESLVSIGVPANDRFQRFIELDSENFFYDPVYPELSTHRTDDFMVFEILLSIGRSVKIKKQLLRTLMERLVAMNISPNDVFVVFKETAWENWAFAGGALLHT